MEEVQVPRQEDAPAAQPHDGRGERAQGDPGDVRVRVEKLYTPCFVCGGPYHPATGGLHYVEFSGRYVPWCGVCERDSVKWLVGHIKGRQRKIKVDGKTRVLKFYDYAHFGGKTE